MFTGGNNTEGELVSQAGNVPPVEPSAPGESTQEAV